MIMYMALIDEPADQEKFEKLYLTYKGLMFHIANQILNNEQDAEDAVHVAFITIAKNIKNIVVPVCPKTQSYIVTIVESKAIDMYRKNRRMETAEYNDEICGVTVELPDEIGLDDCILKLPARYREVIMLKYDQGFTCRDIAKQLGISLESANKLVQRAKNKLMEICKKEGIL